MGFVLLKRQFDSVCRLHFKENSVNKREAGKLGYEKSKLKNEVRVQNIKEAYLKSPSLCSFCSTPLPYSKRNNKYCNHSCAAKNNNTGVSRHSRHTDNVCARCGKPAPRSNKYCTNDCYNSHKWELTRVLIESGEYMMSHMEATIRPTIKRYLIEVQGNVCSICGTSEWMGEPVPLVCDHIDGNADNNNLSNFRIVCGNCDMQLPTFAGRNVGNGSKARSYRNK